MGRRNEKLKWEIEAIRNCLYLELLFMGNNFFLSGDYSKTFFETFCAKIKGREFADDKH